MVETPKVSIVIPTLNNMGMLLECLVAIGATCKEVPHEVIVVCNAATPEISQFLKLRGVKCIAFDDNRGFAAACNAGAKIAEGEYVCFLNDDTLPAKDWLARMLFAFDTMLDGFGCGNEKLGAVGPLSNYVSGAQRIKESNIPLTAANRDGVASSLERKYGLTHFLSGFCIMFKKQLFEEVGGFDEKFYPGGAEDNAICVELLKRGYHLGVVGDAYVFHYGSQTLARPEFRHLDGGNANVPSFYRRYGRPFGERIPKLATIYRVKVQNDYILDVFRRSLDHAACFSDSVIVLDDGTPKARCDLKKEITTLARTHSSVKFIYKYYERAFDEKRDRNELLELAIEAGADWVLALDSDEDFEEKVDYTLMHRLLNPIAPHTFGYAFHEYTFWNDEQHWRVDGVWGSMSSYRLWRVQPNRRIFGGAKSTLHCEHVPLLPPGCISTTSIRIKHYGYVHAAERNRKYMWYENVDTDKQKAFIGHDDYRHLVDESDLRVRPWVEDCTISVTTMMKNEAVNLCQFLDLLWGFADEIVLTDTGSTDVTKELALWAGCTVIEHPWNDDYSAPRNAALKQCTKTWVWQVDLDERVHELAPIRRMMDYPIAQCYMFYIRNLLRDGTSSLSETVRMFRGSLGLLYEDLIHETVDETIRKRGFRIHRAATDMAHFGFLTDPANLKRKMQYYIAMCEKQLAAHPERAKAWYNVALHYMECEELEPTVEKMFQKAIALDPNFYVAIKEFTLLRLRQAARLVNDMLRILPREHEEVRQLHELRARLAPYADQKLAVPKHAREYLERTGKLTAKVHEQAKDVLERPTEANHNEDRANSPVVV